MDYKSIICDIILMEVYMELKNVQNYKNFKNAFTLAEVLITLGIIGVVAAMTLPTLIANYQKSIYENGFKKAVSISTNMFKKMQADEGVTNLKDTDLLIKTACTENADCSDSYADPSFLLAVIPKYLKVVKTCNGDSCNIKYKKSYFYNGKLELVDGVFQVGEFASSYESHQKSTSYTGFYTADGMIFYMSKWLYSSGVEIVVDINGEKGPNTLCRDLFHFYINDEKGFELYNTDIDACTANLISNGYKMKY